MAVTVFSDRKAVVLQWDAGDYDGPVTLRTESEDDVSTTELVANPGFAAVTFPMEYSGAFNVEVLDIEGNVLDSGDVEV